MGMIVEVYRAYDEDCTNGGISAKHRTLCVVNVNGPFDPTDECPAVVLEKSEYGVVRLAPAHREGIAWFKKSGWWVNGGNKASTSDSRWEEAIQRLGATHGCAVPIFDRRE